MAAPKKQAAAWGLSGRSSAGNGHLARLNESASCEIDAVRVERDATETATPRPRRLHVERGRHRLLERPGIGDILCSARVSRVIATGTLFGRRGASDPSDSRSTAELSVRGQVLTIAASRRV